jgi:ATP-dependent Zn protease
MAADDLMAAIAPADTRSPSDIRRAAVHEAGHAVAQIALGGSIESVTIVATERSGGRTRTSGLLPDLPTARDLDMEGVVTLAGRAAEATFLGAPSAGAESDLARATELVCMQHASSGLGSSLVHLAPSGSASALLIDPKFRQTVEQHIARLYSEAAALVRERQADVTAVADALVKRRVLSGAQVRAIALQQTKTRQHAGGMKSGGTHE